MSTTFPTTKQSIPNPTSTDLLENADATLDHDYQHSTINDTIEALQDKVGIDGSATTSTHDYKLSAVTGSAKALTSGTSTQSVTGLTLVTPTLTLGSDATGDMYYRNGSGVLTRLPAGTDGQIIAYSSGIPTVIANPSASAASQTAAGVIEIATTAEQTTGTDDTRASTPKSVHDMTSLAGAAWFLDEDTMSSDSATKTASQQSIKAYVDSNVLTIEDTSVGVGGATSVKDYWNFTIPLLVTTDVPSGNIWTLGANSTFAQWTLNCANLQIGVDNNSSTLTTGGIFIEPGFTASVMEFDTTKKVIVEFGVACRAVGTEQQGFGLTSGGIGLYDYNDTTVDSAAFVIDGAGALYGKTGNAGVGSTETLITGITLTNMNTYRIEFDPGVDVKFYVNGVLKATNTTNLPDGANDIRFGWGFEGNTNNNDTMMVTAPNFAIEK